MWLKPNSYYPNSAIFPCWHRCIPHFSKQQYTYVKTDGPLILVNFQVAPSFVVTLVTINMLSLASSYTEPANTCTNISLGEMPSSKIAGHRRVCWKKFQVSNPSIITVWKAHKEMQWTLPSHPNPQPLGPSSNCNQCYQFPISCKEVGTRKCYTSYVYMQMCTCICIYMQMPICIFRVDSERCLNCPSVSAPASLYCSGPVCIFLKNF